MKKILLYFVLFELNFSTVHTAVNHIAIDSIGKELEECERLCSSAVTQVQKEGYLQKSVLYLSQAINLSKSNLDDNVTESKEEIVDVDAVDNVVNEAAWNFVQAKIKGASHEDIDDFSKKLPVINQEKCSFLEYLIKRHVKCCVEAIHKIMWSYYLKKLILSQKCYNYYHSLTKKDNPLEKRKEGYFGLAAYYLNGVINDARGQTPLSETHNSNLKTASRNFIVAFNYLDRTFDKVKKYKEVDKYFSKKCFIDLYDEIQVKYYDFANAIQQAAQQARLSIFQITEDHIFKLMLKVYFGVDYKEGWWCLIM